ncbi:tetratricopeptide repeat protein [Mariprofundus micogutta]|uniref:Tetratricopeptide repeat protein n=1 Tax=Mariprofundus micogutta TaxID=1921010 RepID=A0A1L8CLD7_9PROT|nr:tetratricopeptide repeat protein [Mariprofundus micogutta]GAV19705.1 tetratricopeptide repeat protein [Mariprofundus micogutta]
MFRTPGISILAILCALVLSACGSSMQKTATEQVSEKTSSSRADIMQMDTQFLYLASQDALKEGDHQLAIELLSALVEKDATAITPRIQLAALLLQSGRQADAEQHVTDLLVEPALSAEQFEQLKLTQIKMLVAKNKMDLALTELDGFLKTRPAHLAAREIQARIFANQDRLDEALTAMDAAIAAEELPEFRLLQAQLLLKNNDLMAARVSLRRMLKLEPASDTAAIMLSGIALKENKADQAEDILRQFLANYPEAVRISHVLGQLLLEQNRIAEAILIYRDAEVASGGGNPDILRSLGMLYFRHQDFGKAEETFSKLVELVPTDQSRFYYATSLEALLKTQKAREIYAAIDINGPMGRDAQIRLAGIDFGDGKLNQAEARLLHIVKEQPENMEAFMMLTGIWLAQKQFKKVISKTLPLLANNKLHPQILFNRAVAYEHLKQYEGVEAMLTRVITKFPKHSEALNFLGYTYAIQGINLNKAESLIKRALQKKPGDGYYLDSLAWVYFRMGNYAKALETQKMALQSISDDAVMFEHYGDILWKNGEFDPARKAWQKAIDLDSENHNDLKNKIADGPGLNQ